MAIIIFHNTNHLVDILVIGQKCFKDQFNTILNVWSSEPHSGGTRS